MSYYLGIDSSTTATKALLMDADGAVVVVGRSEYGYETPHPLWAEQAPDLWWDATRTAVREALGSAGIAGTEIAAIGLTGQMHGLILLDESGDVARPAILWNDQRTEAECDEIRHLVGRQRLIDVTGNDALTGFTAPKILWVRNHEPEVFERSSTMLLPKDYVRYRLTGSVAMDKAGGSGTLLFDLAARNWSPEIAEALGVPTSLLPQTFEGTEVTGVVSDEGAAATGLRPGTPVMAGGGDQAANGVGVGAIKPGIVAVSLGTSGVVFAATNGPVFEPEGRLHAFCHAVPGMWHLMGVMLSAAGSYRWFRDTFAPQVSYESVNSAAAEVSPGSNGLVFLPYLTGERTPHPDPNARGAFVGLTVRHELGHLARSVMEGVAFGLRDSAQLMETEMRIEEVRVSGGGAASKVWLQILADILGQPLQVIDQPEAPALGAAMLAATGDGAFDSVAEASSAAVVLGDTYEPTSHADAYEETYSVYRDLYPILRDSFGRLSDLED
ncbi:MAG: xylulokinase [Actinomycetia bacterium]|nr:xylulokinase [Actinomycetes bacterium]